MSAIGVRLPSVVHSLCNSLGTGVLSQAITEIVFSSNLDDANLTTRDMILQPKFTQFNVPDLAEAAPAGDSFRRTRVCAHDNLDMNADVFEHSLQPQGCTSRFD